MTRTVTFPDEGSGNAPKPTFQVVLIHPGYLISTIMPTKIRLVGLAYLLFYWTSAAGQAYYDSAYKYMNLNRVAALLYADSALQAATSDGDRARAYYMLGYLCRHKQDYIESIENYHRAMVLYKAVDRMRLQEIYVNQGINYEYLVAYKIAAEYYQRAIDYTGGSEAQRAKARRQLGRLYRKMGRYDAAVGQNMTALKYYDRRGDRLQRSAVLNEIGLTLLEAGKYKDAMDYFYASQKYAAGTSMAYVREARTTYSIAECYIGLGDTAQAVEHLETAKTMMVKLPAEHNYVKLLAELATLNGGDATLYKEAVLYARAHGFDKTDFYLDVLSKLAMADSSFVPTYIEASQEMLAARNLAVEAHKKYVAEELQKRLVREDILYIRDQSMKLWYYVSGVSLLIFTVVFLYLRKRLKKFLAIKREMLAVLNS